MKTTSAETQLTGEELKPCPFCGGNKIVAYDDDGLFWKRCVSCGATGPETTKYDGEEGDPYYDWNARADLAINESPKTEVESFHLTRLNRDGWHASGLCYNISLPNYDGGEVVTKSDYDSLARVNESLVAALKEISELKPSEAHGNASTIAYNALDLLALAMENK